MQMAIGTVHKTPTLTQTSGRGSQHCWGIIHLNMVVLRVAMVTMMTPMDHLPHPLTTRAGAWGPQWDVAVVDPGMVGHNTDTDLLRRTTALMLTLQW